MLLWRKYHNIGWNLASITGKRASFLAAGIFCVIYVAIVHSTIWQYHYLPYGDLPMHMFMAQIIGHIETVPADYYLDMKPYPNMFWQLLLGWLSRSFNIEFLTKAILSAYLLVSSLGLYLLVRQFNKSISLLWLPIFLIGNMHYFFQCGYLQFTLSIGLIPYAIIAWLGTARRPFFHILIMIFLSIFFLAMHFMALVDLYLGMLIVFFFLPDKKKSRQLIISYVIGIIVAAICLVLISLSADPGTFMIKYNFSRKITNVVLYAFRPYPIQFFVLIWIIFSNLWLFARLSRPARIRMFWGSACAILIFFVYPSDISMMADADLRLLPPLVISALLLITTQQFQFSKEFRTLTAFWFLIAYIFIIGFNYKLHIKESECYQITKPLRGKSYAMMVNHSVNELTLDRLFFPQGYCQFYMLAYNFYLEPTVYFPKDHVPYVFTTSIIRTSAPVNHYNDYVPPWGECSKFVRRHFATVKNVKHLLIPKTGLEEHRTLLHKRSIKIGNYWVLASLRD